MRLLLDTHALLWSLMDVQRLGRLSEDISDPRNDVFVSTISLLEIAIKARAGKLAVTMEEIVEAIDGQGFRVLPLTDRHVLELEKLPVHADHKDPFDHQLIAQAIAEDMVFVSFDRQAGRYPVKLLS